MKRSMIAAPLLVLSFAGCAIFSAPERPQWTTFLLDVPASASVDASATDAGGATETTDAGGAVTPTDGNTTSPDSIIRVAPIVSGAGYDTPKMAYVRSAGMLEYFARHRWAEAPSAMIAPILVAALERTGTFAAVIDPSSRAVGDVSLESELLTFRMEVDGSSPRFRITIRANLVGAGSRRPLSQARTFEVVETAHEADAPAGAAAARIAAARAADEIAAWSVQVLTASR